jgi:hypothetical protein
MPGGLRITGENSPKHLAEDFVVLHDQDGRGRSGDLHDGRCEINEQNQERPAL